MEGSRKGDFIYHGQNWLKLDGSTDTIFKKSFRIKYTDAKLESGFRSIKMRTFSAHHRSFVVDNPAKGGHSSILGTCEYVTLHDRRNFDRCD